MFFSLQEVTDSRILCLALVHLAAEKESWMVCGTQAGALLGINAADDTKRHTLEKMTDSVTCLYCNSFAKQRYVCQLIDGDYRNFRCFHHLQNYYSSKNFLASAAFYWFAFLKENYEGPQ